MKITQWYANIKFSVRSRRILSPGAISFYPSLCSVIVWLHLQEEDPFWLTNKASCGRIAGCTFNPSCYLFYLHPGTSVWFAACITAAKRSHSEIWKSPPPDTFRMISTLWFSWSLDLLSIASVWLIRMCIIACSFSIDIPSVRDTYCP